MTFRGGFTPSATLRTMPLLLAIAFAGCDAGESADPHGQRHVVTSDSVHVLPTSESLVRVLDLWPGRADSVWVLNAMEPYVLVISALDGRVLYAGGRRGSGPQEFSEPTALTADGSGRVWIYDHHSNALTAGDLRDRVALSADSLLTGRLLSQEAVGTVTGRTWIHHSADRFFVARSRLGSAGRPALSLWQSDLVSFVPQGDVRVALPVADLLGAPAERFGSGGTYGPYPLWTQCADGTFELYDPNRNAVRRFDAAGGELGERALPPERAIAITEAGLFAMLVPAMLQHGADTAAMRRQMAANWPEFSRGVARVFPEYSELHCGEDGGVWLQRFDPNAGMGRGVAWLRLEADRALAVDFPPAFHPIHFAKEQVWGVIRDEVDLESIAWIRTPR
jgi:hypothetical protein